MALRHALRGSGTGSGRASLDIRLHDLDVFLAVVRCGSIRGAARELGLTPSQVSKTTAKLENRLGRELLVRGDHGISVNEAGLQAAQRAEAMLGEMRALEVGRTDARPPVKIAGTASLNQCLVPPLVERLGGVPLRSLELPPGLAAAHASSDLFSMVLTTSDEPWPPTWSKLMVGELRYALFGTPTMSRSLGRMPITAERLHGRPFVSPVYAYNGQAILGDDACPLPLSLRKLGHETQTLTLALEIAARADQLVFAPRIAARGFVDSGLLAEMPVRGWDVRRPLWLVCHGERVTAALRSQVVRCLRETLAA